MMLMMNMIPMQTVMLMPVIMTDEDNSEYDSVNGDADEDNSVYDAVNGDTDADRFGADNNRTNNAGTYNVNADIDTTDTDDGDAGYNDNGDPNDTDAQHETDFLSSVVQSCLALDLYVFMVMTLLWDLRATSSRK